MWLSCPASVTQTKDAIRPSSKYAREGTAAHAVAEMIILGDIFLPDRITVEGEEFIVSPGMVRALNPYVTFVQARMAEGATGFIEHRVKVPDTYNLVWGTMDFGAQDPIGDLDVVDLKFGRGVAVDPSGPQLKFYALGLAGLLGTVSVDADVRMTICQPRLGNDPIRTHTESFGSLLEWRGSVVQPALAKIKKGDATEVAGHYCRWCVRQTECKAFARRHQNTAAAAFED